MGCENCGNEMKYPNITVFGECNHCKMEDSYNHELKKIESKEKIIKIRISEPSSLSIGEIRMIHQECMNEFKTLYIKNALWLQFGESNKLDCEDVELISFTFLDGCYEGKFRIRFKPEFIISGDSE